MWIKLGASIHTSLLIDTYFVSAIKYIFYHLNVKFLYLLNSKWTPEELKTTYNKILEIFQGTHNRQIVKF